MDVKRSETGYFYHGLKNMPIKSDLRFVRLMQILKDKASFLLLSLRTATQSYMRLPLNSEKKPIY